MSDSMAPAPLDIATMGNGALRELFNRELGKLLRNIADPNVPAEGKRTIIMKVSFTPSKDRAYAGLELLCTSKLQDSKGYETGAYLGKVDGKLVAMDTNPAQRTLGEDTEEVADDG